MSKLPTGVYRIYSSIVLCRVAVTRKPARKSSTGGIEEDLALLWLFYLNRRKDSMID
jgi:hypothetical protein